MRKTTVLISILFSLAVFTACGSTGTDNSQAAQTAPAPTATAAPTPTPEPTPTPFPDYDFEVYGCKFNTADYVIDLNHIKVEDEGEELLKYLPDCHNLEVLDMDSCGVDNEHMAEIRDAYPEVDVIWRVKFAENYTVRTDVVKILASNPGEGGVLYGKRCDGLNYCTKVKYLDIGHNNYLKDISFVRNMPDLEVIILAQDCAYETGLADISPLADCPKLEFIEIQGTRVSDLSPLSGLTELRHLNIGADPFITDIIPIMDLELDRLWITGTTPVPHSQANEFREKHPNCEVNNTCGMPNDGWKGDAPRYLQIKETFGYHDLDYQIKENDPLYYEHESIYTDYIPKKDR